MLELLVRVCLRKQLAFFDSSDMNIDFLSVPMMIRSLANSNCDAFNLSAPSTAALIAAMFTRFARSDRKMTKDESNISLPDDIAVKLYSIFQMQDIYYYV